MKLPKSMSKLKSRKIFRSSREDVHSVAQRSSSKRQPSGGNESLTLPLGGPPYTIPPSEFINRTPTRISTISSLMNQSGGGGGASSKTKSHKEDENFYRSAGGIDDYYPSPLSQRFEQRLSRPISPVKPPISLQQEYPTQSEQNIKMSFSERVQKGYKDVSSFRLKHIFAKKTVVRKDNIEVTNYSRRYEEDRQRDVKVQEIRDRHIADNYRFQFKESNQNSDESFGNSPMASPRSQVATKKIPKSLSELSGDESGMESSPPKRKPGIAATRFAKVRSPPLNMSLEEDDDGSDGIDENIHLDEEEEFDNPKPNTSSLYVLRKQKSNEKVQVSQQSPQKSKSFKERISRLTKQKSETDEIKKETEKKRRAPLSPQQSEEQTETVANPTQPEKPFDVIKHNFKRLQKSMKLPQSAVQSGAESENEDASNQETKQKLTKTQQITERLKRFRSVDNVDKSQDEDENKTVESPIRKIKQKLIEWKKSIKKNPGENQNTENDDEDEPGSPQKRDRPVGSLMKKLKHIRSRKHGSTDDPDEDEEGGDTYKESLRARAKLQLEKGVVAASQVPQRTMKKISETKKYFRKNREQDGKKKSDKTKSDDEEEDGEEEQKVTHKRVPELPAAKPITRPPPPIPRPYYRDTSDEDEDEDDDDDDEEEDYNKKITIETKQIMVPTIAKTAWTTKPILSDDTTDYDDEVPRVLIHQDNSDLFESTLIIAVTRPRSHCSTPIITELPPDYLDEDSTPDTKPDNWIPHTDKISSFLEITPPSQRKNSKDSTSYTKGHSRKQSIDSSSEDSWIKDVPRDVSNAVGLNSVHESEEPWKVQRVKDDDKLYKTKSIDIFEFHHKNGGGALTAFEDFDDELKNTPIVKIDESKLIEIHLNGVSFERDSSEELDNADDDNSSRITKISVHAPKVIPKTEKDNIESELKSLPYGNSRESLMGNIDDNDAIAVGEQEDNEDSEEDEDEYDDDDEDDDDEEEEEEEERNRPPSKAPSPPPSISPPPPPLPQRQPSIRLSKLSQSSVDSCPSLPPPPLPTTKPPIPPNRPIVPPPPKIPERTPSTTHISKPLVKTSSLRLAYSEQVNPQDVGKVNKLISRFEPNGGPKHRPRIIPRKPYMASESEEYSDNEEEEEEEDEKEIDLIRQEKRDRTPTNLPRMQKSFSIDSADVPINNNNNNNSNLSHLPRKATSQTILDNSTSVMAIPTISISSSCQDVNLNFSQPNSVYGSPLTYPSSLVGSTEVTPLSSRRDSDFLATRRNRRSMQRDDENFYSFDSDEGKVFLSIKYF